MSVEPTNVRDQLPKLVVTPNRPVNTLLSLASHVMPKPKSWMPSPLDQSGVPDDVYFAHDDMERRTQNLQEAHERQNGHAHVKQMLLSATSHSIPVAAGEPLLGRWQRLLFLELDDPKERQIMFHVIGE